MRATDLIRRAVARKGFQPMWRLLHRAALIGMNVGSGSHVTSSGEWDTLVRAARLQARRDVAEPVVFDVGANVGDYAGAARRAFGPKAFVHCFEPAGAAFASLTSRHAGDPRVIAHRLGLSDEEGSLILYANHEGSGVASVYDRRMDHFGEKMKPVETIPVDTLDAVADRLGIERIHLLKLDVEGHELAVLRGARKLLAERRIDVLQFEFGGCNIDSRTFLQDFYYHLHPGYRLHRVVANGWVPLDRYRETDEMFVTTNFVAVRADLQAA